MTNDNVAKAGVPAMAAVPQAATSAAEDMQTPAGEAGFQFMGAQNGK